MDFKVTTLILLMYLKTTSLEIIYWIEFHRTLRLEDIEDLAVVAERINEPNIPHDKVLKELKEDGHLPD